MTNDLIIRVSDDLRYVMTEEHYSYLTIGGFLRFKDARVEIKAMRKSSFINCTLQNHHHLLLEVTYRSMCMLLEEVSPSKFLNSYFIRIIRLPPSQVSAGAKGRVRVLE